MSSKILINKTTVECCFTNLQLSFRGAERQAPHVLSLALMFSKVMQASAEDGSHPSSWGTEERLKAVINAFNSKDGVLAKWAVDEEKEKAILNILVGTTPTTRQLISTHLSYHKWKESSFTSELLKSSRWLLGAMPKNCKPPFKQLLAVSPSGQENFIRNHIAKYLHDTRKVRASTKPKFRPSVQEWDKVVNYTQVMEGVKAEVKEFFKEDPQKATEVNARVQEAFMSRRGWWSCGEICTSDFCRNKFTTWWILLV